MLICHQLTSPAKKLTGSVLSQYGRQNIKNYEYTQKKNIHPKFQIIKLTKKHFKNILIFLEIFKNLKLTTVSLCTFYPFYIEFKQSIFNTFEKSEQYIKTMAININLYYLLMLFDIRFDLTSNY